MFRGPLLTRFHRKRGSLSGRDASQFSLERTRGNPQEPESSQKFDVTFRIQGNFLRWKKKGGQMTLTWSREDGSSKFFLSHGKYLLLLLLLFYYGKDRRVVCMNTNERAIRLPKTTSWQLPVTGPLDPSLSLVLPCQTGKKGPERRTWDGSEETVRKSSGEISRELWNEVNSETKIVTVYFPFP